MEVRIRNLRHELVKSFGSSGRVEIIHFSDDAKYEDVLSMFKEKLKCNEEVSERTLDAFVLICGGRTVLTTRDEPLNSDCEVLVGYADTGG